jgi:hypothetical protein
VKKVQRPDIKSCAGQVDARRRFGLNNHGHPRRREESLF